ncbi:MAG: hypothetical protein ABIK37_02920 [candidate division WOR-3 bacterium]
MRLALRGLALLLAVAAGQPDSSAAPDSGRPAGLRIVSDGPVRVAAKLVPRRGTLTVGDRFEVEVQVSHPRNVKVSPPFMEQPGDYVVTGQKAKTRYQGDTVVEVHRLTLAAFTVGTVKVPPFLSAYQDVAGTAAAASDSLELKVASVMPADMQDINDLKPQIQYPNLLPVWILAGLIAAGIGVWLGWRWWRRVRRKRAEPASLPEPWDEALAALGALPVLDLISAGQIKRYYYAVSEILKRYLTRRYGFAALDQTTTEISRELKARRVAEREKFVEFFLRADMVKYAKLVPPAAEMEAAVERARELVRLTTPAPEPPAGQAPAGAAA